MLKSGSTKEEKLNGIRLAGVTITRATGFNAKFIIDNGIGPGAIVEIVRSGEVIPHITRVVKKAKKTSTPSDQGFDWEWNKTKVQAVLKKNAKNDTARVKRITYFFDKLGVEGLKQGTVQKLYDNGFTSILKIVRIKRDQLLAIDGIQQKKADATINNMKDALSKMTLPALMDASGLFGQGMGEKRIALVLKKYPNILTVKSAPKYLVERIVDTVRGFSTTLAEQLVIGIPKFNVFYTKLGIKAQAMKTVQKKGAAFKGQTIVWTGFRNKAQELVVEEQGGTVGSGVSSATTILVVKDSAFTSSKVTKAKAAGVKVMTNAQFQSLIDKKSNPNTLK